MGSIWAPQRQASPGERMARGAAALNLADPGWWLDDGGPRVIDLATLRMDDPSRSVLGQRFAAIAEPVPGGPGRSPDPYRTGLRLLGIPEREAGAYGFTGAGGADADQLTRMWLLMITTLRAEGPPPP